MTRELVLARKQDLEAQLAIARGNVAKAQEQMVAAQNQLQAVGGAVQDCDFWLEQLTAEEMKTKSTAGTFEERPARVGEN
jgi:hypothetical protein